MQSSTSFIPAEVHDYSTSLLPFAYACSPKQKKIIFRLHQHGAASLPDHSRAIYSLLSRIISILRAESRTKPRFWLHSLHWVSLDSEAMYLVEDTTGAIVLMILSLFCLGSWPVLFNILERKGRLPQHTYLDYAISTFLVALLFAVTVGQLGRSEQNFSIQLSQVFGSPAAANVFDPRALIRENWMCAMIAMLGGLSLCVGNVLMQYSLVFLGISLTEVVSASIAVVVGTTINYFLDHGLNRASILFPGVACFLVAIVLGSLCHASNSKDIKNKLQMAIEDRKQDEIPGESNAISSTLLLEKPSGQQSFHDSSVCQLKHNSTGTSEFFHHLETTRAVKIQGFSVIFGLSIAFLAGLCYALFSPLVNVATNDQFHLLQGGVPELSVYTAFFFFSLALLACAMLINIYLLYNPVLGLEKSSIALYVQDNNGRLFAILAGIVCGIGNGFQFMGGEAAGFAAADAVQAMPLVGTFWGIVLFGEYHNSSARTYILLVSMLAMFIIALGFLVGSSRSRF